jgi:hypothetical protein
MRECSYLNCIQGQDLWVLLAPFGSDTRFERCSRQKDPAGPWKPPVSHREDTLGRKQRRDEFCSFWDHAGGGLACLAFRIGGVRARATLSNRSPFGSPCAAGPPDEPCVSSQACEGDPTAGQEGNLTTERTESTEGMRGSRLEQAEAARRASVHRRIRWVIIETIDD